MARRGKEEKWKIGRDGKEEERDKRLRKERGNEDKRKLRQTEGRKLIEKERWGGCRLVREVKKEVQDENTGEMEG